MRVLGIDPGTERTGYGIIETLTGQGCSSYKMIDYGCIVTSRELSLAQRLIIIRQNLTAIISQYHPDTASVEEIFFSKNMKTAISVSHARGVILLTMAEAGINVFEYTPLQVKSTVCGDGHASKVQIQKVVKLLLSLDHVPKPDDAADGLAIAICHIQTDKIRKLTDIHRK
ncbi:crossover junction endodeoxyribonuclease RuvC [Candidatus Desantisbacteria bacterium CG2_30_40_21]|uniref:Crossover junction endodeoxyribonuclease RuvC n=5 Tax=unclassified Candidatus Desantisiibacteriota TaxID=3106372 RepID=A0A2M7J9C1_9BACT|nr:MAG: crossover junction endodeoxyribonuclease RuvC [Candidatus Desantisbacteria bacterium CG2_30_40_21]PIP39708.1 MAG: crossover junction endodeoxyribonuclease RuvC [Candidatus Desantisbacteria bacterium CG23_combo_of_CG06-09_8_20_14_all_40_23]PIX16010.1 MAG: crossover junction endodeoxyribonuclease RuvC [Candidatus Desantisbacteria bacterium CG_4_8_14_3_um_filter_40_12]PIY19038.1 MAG: crossover junction endodeoxyribonuclease RuvC [Candidatus Desantisbacteria bacterium CG_4_10_14_3_um_filter_